MLKDISSSKIHNLSALYNLEMHKKLKVRTLANTLRIGCSTCKIGIEAIKMVRVTIFPSIGQNPARLKKRSLRT